MDLDALGSTAGLTLDAIRAATLVRRGLAI